MPPTRSQRRGSRDYSDSDPEEDDYRPSQKSSRGNTNKSTNGRRQYSSGEEDESGGRPRRESNKPRLQQNPAPTSSSSSRPQNAQRSNADEDSGEFESRLPPGNFGAKAADSIYLSKNANNNEHSPTNAGATVRVVARARNAAPRPGAGPTSSHPMRPTGSFVPRSTTATSSISSSVNNARTNNFMNPQPDPDFEEEIVMREDSRGSRGSQQPPRAVRSSRDRDDDDHPQERRSRDQQPHMQSSSRSKPLEESWTKAPTAKKFLTEQEEEETAMARASKSSWGEPSKTLNSSNLRSAHEHLQQPQLHHQVKKTTSKYSTMNNKSDIEPLSDDDDNLLDLHDDNKYHPGDRKPATQHSNKKHSNDDFSIEGEDEDEHPQLQHGKASHRKDHGDFEEEEVAQPARGHSSAAHGQHQSSATRSKAVTMLRKSGRYSDEEDKEDQGTGQSYANSSNDANAASGTGGWVTGQQPARHAMSHLAPATFSTSSRHSFVLVAHPRGLRTQHVQCTIIRDRSSIHGKLYPTYELILEEPRKTLIVAQKMSLNRTSNYHLFDMTRGQAGSKLSKKSGNYLGKLRAKNSNRTGYALMNHKYDREEVAGVLFDRVTVIDQIKDGNQPRRMNVLTPPIDEEGICQPVSIGSLGVESLTDLLACIEDKIRTIPDDFVLMHTKDPVFENGNYRLNFHGRVSMPSVKNFQMVSDDNIEDIKCQFGKVDKDVFHLDYKAPFNALQAFALALCQFNL